MDNNKVKCASITKSYDTLDNPLDICIPQTMDAFSPAEKEGFHAMIEYMKDNAGGKIAEDVMAARKPIFISFALGVIWCIIYIYFMSFFAETLAWTCVFLI